MRDWAGRTYWLIGASEGLGRALAGEMARAGASLVLSARSAGRLEALAGELPGKHRVLTLDVSDPGSVRAAADAAGPIDGLVYLAALYWPMRAQDWTPDEVEAMLDVNLTGAARVLGRTLPAMVARGRGHVVITGSLSGYRGLPGAIGYGASKAGVMHLAESMRMDLRGTGVEVQLVNPGFIRTRLTDRNDFAMPFIMDPGRAARLFFAQMNRRTFSANFPRGFAALLRGSQFLPDWLYFRLF